MKLFRCRFCGHEIEADNLSGDFICPVCGHTGEDFDYIKDLNKGI